MDEQEQQLAGGLVVLMFVWLIMITLFLMGPGSNDSRILRVELEQNSAERKIRQLEGEVTRLRYK